MEKERLKFCIERFDHYYDSINNKSAVFLGLGTFAIGGLLALFSYLSNDEIVLTNMMWISMLLALVFAFAAILVVIFASMPYKSKKDKTSLFYYNSIAIKGLTAFSAESKNYNFEDELTDLREQVYKLSIGLKRKFRRLRIVAILHILMFVSLIPLFINIFLIFKR